MAKEQEAVLEAFEKTEEESRAEVWDRRVTDAKCGIAERIVKARKEKGYTQTGLAKMLGRNGVSRAAVAQWEIGRNSPDIFLVTDLARILDVDEGWLAFGRQPGETAYRYISPERDNILWINETVFGDDLEDSSTVSSFGIPYEFLRRELNASPENTIICTINSHAVEPSYEYGEKVFVDRSDVRPSPAGVFAYWDGVGMVFGTLQALPGVDPKVKISAHGREDETVPLKELQIIGRVKGRIQRG